MRQAEPPSIGEPPLELIREYSIGAVPDDGDMGKLTYRQRKCLSTTENSITGQQHDRLGKSHLTSWLDVPGPERRKVVFAGTDFRLSAKGNPFAVAKTIDDRERNVVLSSGIVTDVDDHSFQHPEVIGNHVKNGC